MSSTDLLELADAKAAIKASDASVDAELPLYIAAATEVVEDIIGPVLHRAVTHVVADGQSAITLPSYPVASVMSVLVDGSPLAVGGYTLSAQAGIVTLPTAYRDSATITYIAGRYATRGEVPSRIKMAARIILVQAWRADKQGTRPGMNAADAGTTTASGFLIPHRAAAFLSGLEQLDGFA